MLAEVLFAAAALSASTTQEPAEGGWVRMEDARVPAIYPTGDGEGGPLFTCNEGRYGLVIALDTMDFEDAIANSSKRRRNLSGAITVDGEETYSGYFSYKPAAGTAATSERKPAAQIFNAVIRGQSVIFRLSGKGERTLTLPPVDDTFTAFAAECREQQA